MKVATVSVPLHSLSFCVVLEGIARIVGQQESPPLSTALLPPQHDQMLLE